MDFPLSEIKGIGPQRQKALKAAGIDTVRRLLLRLPVDYRDLSEVRPLANLSAGDVAAVEVWIHGAVSARYYKGLHITRARVTDGSDVMPAVWFNQPWLKGKLNKDEPLLLYGRVEAKGGGLQLTSPSFEREKALIPVYAQVAGVPANVLRDAVRAALGLCEGQWPDELPESLRFRHGLCERNFAMREAHIPTGREALIAARRRLAFEELLLYQVALGLMRGGRGAGVAVDCADAWLDEYWAANPFPPTGAQQRVLGEVARDLRAPQAMARLVQGDVGSGKTAIALGALYLVARAGFQGALMAPTEVLAQQHYESAKALLGPLGITCGLLTGSLPAARKRAAHEAIASGAWRVAIGTHALISEAARYENLGLVITDEQHRFGVRQRTALSQKGISPNVLVMSATPIPRTLSLILYGDLDVSVVDELPPGRSPVKTRLVPEDKRAGLYGFLRAQIAQGRQVYVVCPLVEDSEALEAKSAQATYEALANGPLAGHRIALAHGQMKPRELEAVLSDFRSGKLSVLVATTVVEVGVNVPNASVMVIESAERFGLAQLHQLRGRVGRGAYQSWCFLMAEAGGKLKLLTETCDGFKIAEKDLEIRGAGDLFGYRQSGLAIGGLGALASDMRLLEETHEAARALMRERESEEARQVIALARAAFEKRFHEVAMN
ncbi:MAG: ATP-dependent DNA helicase RecG [Eubacteriales bacterium]|nr:ATP-dependent DNA helicase RecG [Christensenellaceae bacterium]MEA5065863.1 ATP-dependent DNA helicase RecG [Eubacteriales bacterium]